MTRRPFLTTLLLLPLVACEAQKSENPLSPAIAGPIAGVEITAPRQVQPAQGIKIKESQQPVTLVAENSASNGVRPVAYTFEVAADSAFTTKMYARSGVQPGPDGRSTVTVDRLESGRAYYWRVQGADGANSSPFSTSSFEVLPKPLLNPPVQQSPIENAQIPSRRPELMISGSVRNAAVGNITYEFQISSDVAFSGIVSRGERAEAGSTTSYVPDADLNASTTYYWRVRASDGETTSAWANTQPFRTNAAPAPGPSPGPGPGPSPGAPCNFSTGEAIVRCERNKHGFMDDAQIVAFMRDVVDSLNRNNVPGGRFGLLLKPTGANCHGYSCDIVCSGNGGAQRQWDILVDVGGSQGPAFSEVPNIAQRVCEIR